MDLDTERERTSCDSGSRDWSEADTIQGAPSVAGHLQKLGERPRTDSLSEPPEGTNPTDTLISDFELPEQ